MLETLRGRNIACAEEETSDPLLGFVLGDGGPTALMFRRMSLALREFGLWQDTQGWATSGPTSRSLHGGVLVEAGASEHLLCGIRLLREMVVYTRATLA